MHSELCDSCTAATCNRYLAQKLRPLWRPSKQLLDLTQLLPILPFRKRWAISTHTKKGDRLQLLINTDHILAAFSRQGGADTVGAGATSETLRALRLRIPSTDLRYRSSLCPLCNIVDTLAFRTSLMRDAAANGMPKPGTAWRLQNDN
eukprot:SAG31_NODE_374_length_16577_cov_9.902173_6_plen_148_part_00